MYLEAALCCVVPQHTNQSVCETERMNIGGGCSDDSITANGCGQFAKTNLMYVYIKMYYTPVTAGGEST